MSGPGPAGSAEGAPDPSMEEILASIRRILSDDETAAAAPEGAAVAGDTLPEEAVDDILDLDPGMLVSPPPPAPPPELEPEPEPPEPVEFAQGIAAEPLEIHPEPPPARPDPFDDLPEPLPPPPPPPPPPPEIAAPYEADEATVLMPEAPLVGPEAAEAAAQSLDSLVRTLVAGRATQVHRGGPTIEDLVREEIRPLLKEWLDEHLPPLVERLVRAEIEHVVSRTQL